MSNDILETPQSFLTKRMVSTMVDNVQDNVLVICFSSNDADKFNDGFYDLLEALFGFFRVEDGELSLKCLDQDGKLDSINSGLRSHIIVEGKFRTM